MANNTIFMAIFTSKYPDFLFPPSFLLKTDNYIRGKDTNISRHLDQKNKETQRETKVINIKNYYIFTSKF